jgi:hypothetical protein
MPTPERIAQRLAELEGRRFVGNQRGFLLQAAREIERLKAALAEALAEIERLKQ